MSVTVTNTGTMNGVNTKGMGAVQGDQGTVRVIIEKVEYVFGPNESKTFSDDGIGLAVQAADGRLSLAGQPQGFAAKANASLSYVRY
jgi:hypothetical protein